MINSIIIMLNLVICCRFWVLLLFINFSMGLIIMFVIKYFRIDFSFMCEVSGIVIIIVIRKIVVW